MPFLVVYMLQLGPTPCRTMQYQIPDVEEGIPLPKNSAEALPQLSAQEELEMLGNTVREISDLTGQPIIPDAEEAATAHDIAREIIKNPQTRPHFNAMSAGQIAILQGYVREYQFELVDDLIKLKTFVINKLVEEVKGAPDSKTRIAALTKLGEVDGVDAFKKRSEVTMQIKPIEEVEKELINVLEGIEYRVLGDKDTPVDG